eukprot:353414-Chlamydomonas_euryale.AAC.8
MRVSRHMSSGKQARLEAWVFTLRQQQNWLLCQMGPFGIHIHFGSSTAVYAAYAYANWVQHFMLHRMRLRHQLPMRAAATTAGFALA